MKKILFSALVAASLFSCQSETKPAFDLANAQNEINEANRSFENFVSKGDSVGLATNVYTIDAKFMNPNAPSAEGRAAVTSAISGIFKSGITGIKLTSKEIWGDGNTITEEGAFELNIKDGTVVEKGKYLVMWKKEDGKWKIHRDMFSSDMPIANK
ncbi:MAG: hypothetical protein RI995_1486 [Bacteroidota bacterium]|jgi:ketosteroid isomerase-like protein